MKPLDKAPTKQDPADPLDDPRPEQVEEDIEIEGRKPTLAEIEEDTSEL